MLTVQKQYKRGKNCHRHYFVAIEGIQLNNTKENTMREKKIDGVVLSKAPEQLSKCLNTSLRTVITVLFIQ